MSPGASFNIPEYYQRPQRVSQVWQLRKGKRFATCVNSGPIRSAVRFASMSRANFCGRRLGRQGFALIDKANEWRAARV